MKCAESNISGRQSGLLKASRLLNGKLGILHHGSIANVNSVSIMCSLTVAHCPRILFIAGFGKSVLWYVIP